MKKVGNTSFLTKFFDAVPGKRLFGIYRCLSTVLPHSFRPATLLPNVPSHVYTGSSLLFSAWGQLWSSP